MKKIYSNPNINWAFKIKLPSFVCNAKTIVLFLIVFLHFGINTEVKAQFSDIYESYAILKINGGSDIYYNLKATTGNGNPDFDGANLGTFYSGHTLILNGAENKVYKCNTDDITSGNLYYRIYKTSVNPNSPFIPFQSNSLSYKSGGDPAWCGGINQIWDSTSAGINVLGGLTPGTYYLEVYTNADYKVGGVQQGIPHYANVGGANYKATFTFSPIMVELTSQTNVVCNGASTGSIDITASGKAPFTYDWADIAGTSDTEDRTNLAAGTYDVVVTDATGFSTATLSVILTAPSAVTISSAVKTLYNGADLSCATSTDGAITVTASGGTGTLTYSKDNGSTYQASNVFSGLAAGTYQIVVRDINLCTSTPTAVTITAPSALTISSAVKTLYNGADLSCATSTDGVITVTASGGTGTSTYSKDNGSTYQASNVFSGLAAGTYQIVVRDVNLCVSSATAVILTAPSAVTISSAVKTLYNGADLSCATSTDGVITVTASGGTGTSTYSKDNGSTYQASNVFSGLAAGTYQIVVRDANLCVSSATTVILTAPSAVTISSAVKTLYNGADLSCATSNDGAITVTASGGTGTLTYSKDNGSSYQASNLFSGLAAGTYQIVVRDVNLCVSSATTVILTAPSAVTITGAVKTLYNGADLSCATATDGAITVTASGGTGALEYSKNNGSTYQVSNVFSGLAAGTYQIVVRDTNLCTSTPTAVTITAPSAVTISSTIKTLYNGADLSCATSTNGVVTVTASGGTGTLTYSKDNGLSYQASNIFSGLAAGTYQIVVRDANLCTSSATAVTITAPTAVTISSAVKTLYNGADLSCATSTDGVITVTASGGTGTLTYSKDNGSTYQVSNVFSGLAAGTYQIVVRDVNLCTSSATSVTITAPSAITISSAVKTLYNGADLSCATSTDGVITVTASGGTGTLTYSKDNGLSYQASNIFSGLAAGTYQIVVRDANLCISTATTVILTAPSAVTISSAVKTLYNGADLSCATSTDGVITVTASGGTGTLTYSKDNGLSYQASNIFSGLAAGTYPIVVRDANLCVSLPTSVTITAPSALTISSAVKTLYNGADLSCATSTDGVITVTASGGTGTLTYSKDNGLSYQASNIFSGLAAGTYQIVVRDANLCISTATTVILTAPSAVTISSAVKTLYNGADLSCATSTDGVITVTASGGTGTLTYSKDNGSTYQASNIFSGLAAGTYQIVVRDANLCTSSATSVTITAPTAVTISSAVKTLYNGADLSCSISTNGLITVTASGGTGTLEYSKDNGSTYQASNVFSGLAAGTYQIVVRDVNLCTSSATSVTITAPSAITISSAVKTLYNGADLSCATSTDGVITVTASGGTGTLEYSKDNGLSYQASNIFSGLAAGTYPIVVRDANLCISTATTVILTAPSAVTISSAVKTLYNGADLSCATSTDGVITVTASGGTVTLTYSKDNGSTYQASNVFSGLAAGTYQIVVRDANLCTSSATSVTITAPSAITISSAVKTLYNGADLSCATSTDAVITVTASGGTGTLEYSKNNGSTYQVSNVFSGLAAGTYQIVVRDVNLCVSSATAVILTAPSAVTISSAVKTLYNGADLSCATSTNGVVTVTASGGTGTLTYSKDNGLSYQASNIFSGLAAGTYQIVVRDANLCISTATTVILTAPSAVTISSAVKTLYNGADLSCATSTDGVITVTASGGTGTLTYSKDNGSTYQASNVFSGLAAGTYQIVVRDVNLCVSLPTTVTITAPSAITISSAVKTLYNGADLSCATSTDAVITVTASGGTGTLEYSKNNGSTYQVSNVFSGLAAGTYQIVVRDVNLCTSSATSVTITAPSAITISSAVKTLYNGADLSCATSTDGVITVTASGGTGTLTYSKDNGLSYQASNIFSGLAAGTYQIVVRDANLCISTATTVILTAPSAVTISSAVKTLYNGADLSCATSTDGVITVTASGGTGTLTYSKDNGSTYQASNIFSGLAAGTYPIVVRDSNLCVSLPTSVTITAPPALTITAISSNTPICFGSTLNLISTAFGGTGVITYSWTGPNSFTSNIQNPSISGATIAASGRYNLTVTDANGCSKNSFVDVIVNPLPVLTCPATDVSVCVNNAPFVLNIATPSGGTYIGTGVSGGSFNPSTAGVGAHTLTYTYVDINGCISSCNFRIIVNQAPTVIVSLSSQSVCSGLPIADIVISNPNNVAGTTFSWTRTTPVGLTGIANNGTGSPISGTFLNSTNAAILVTFTITASNGTCSSSTNTTVTVNPTATVSATNNVQTICSGNTIAGIGISNPNAVPGTTYNWTRDNTANLTGIASSGSSNPITGSLTNSTSTQQTAIFSITATTPNGCISTTIATIIVNPRPSVIPQTTPVCSGDQFTFKPADGGGNIVPTGTTYTWTVAVQAGIAGASAQATAQTSISQTLVNSNALPRTATYTVTPTSGTCVGNTFTLTVTVNPLPPATEISFRETTPDEKQNIICNGAEVGGGGQNDLDIHPRPTANFYDINGYAWAWEYSLGTSTGPDGNWLPTPGTTTIFYQHVLPPPPSVFSPIGDYYFRFSLTKNGCTTYSDIIHLEIVSTIILNAGGPDMICQSGTPVPITLSGASVGGTSTPLSPRASWSIVSGGGSLSSTAFTTTPALVTYTPAAGFTGTAVLKLTSNDPDSSGTCLALVETREIIVLPPGNIQGCIAPANWTLTNTNANGSLDVSQAPCNMALIGGNNGSGNIGTSDLKICSGTGTFSFNWGFTASTNIGLTPVWQIADQTTNIGAGASAGTIVANRPSNLAAGNLIIVVLHARDNIGNVTAPNGFTAIRRETSGNNGNNDRGTVISYWKIATATEPATYTFQAGSMASGDTWVATAGRVTGHDPTNPIDANSGANSGNNGVTSITIPALITSGPNRLLIAALSIVDNDHTPTKPVAMTTLYSANSSTGDDITFGGYSQNVGNGTTGTRQFSWANSDPVAALMFAIKPAILVDDAAYVIVNGVETLITNTNGTSGAFSIAVNANDQIGFRVKTNTNTGGVGKLTIYNPVIPNNVPVVTGLTAITIPVCNPAIPTNYFVTPTVTDNCIAPSLVATYPQTSAVVPAGCTSAQTRTWKYVDSCGLESLPFVQTITWTVDTTAPTFTGTYSNVAIGCNPTAAAITTALGNATATEGCSTAAISFTDAAVIISGCSRSQTRTFAATDGCGNIATPVTRTVTWTVDVTFPTVTATGTTTNLGCNPTAAAIDAALGTATGTDGCATPTVTFSDAAVVVSGCDRSQTRTFTVTDICNNVATTTRTVTWKVDTTPPTASNPATINIVGCNAAIPVPNINVVIDEADNCGTPVVAFISDATALVGCLETTTRTYSVTDACNNAINVTQSITRTFDFTKPVITCPLNQTFCQVALNNYTIPTLVSNDNCSGALTVTYSITGATTRSGSGNDASGLFNLGVSTIVWTVTDACGNTSNCSVTVTINPLPGTPIVVTITQPDCINLTGSVVLTGLPLGGTINPGAISYAGTTCTIAGLSVGTHTFTLYNGTCTSAPSANVVINAATIATWDGSGWINGPPTINQALIFTGSYDSSLDLPGDLTACSCTVTNGTVVFNSDHTLKITNWVHVNGGSLTFNSNASLVQINDVSNTNLGNILYERETTKITKMDYTYWSTPVLPFTLGGVSPNTLGDKFYSYDANAEDWKQESSATFMVPGLGYIIRGPQDYVPPAPPATYKAPFVGVPNNGPYPITGIIADRSYLLGNPYPSALDADTFLLANQNVLDGTLYFWTHNTPIAIGTPDPGSGLYAYSGNDYASYNRTGGVGTAAKSAIPGINNDNIPSGKITSGQGFFGSSKTVADGFVSGTPILYNNSMRVGVGGITGNNSQFFKTKKPIPSIAIKKHRIWLDLINAQGAFKQTLVGYVTDATNGYEGRFDGESYDGNDFLDFYSILQDKNLTIQGRALPFDENDEIPLGYRVAVGGTFSIVIDQIDGVLSNQAVFIEDKLNNIVYNLKNGKYTFNTAAGTFDDRFVLRYKDKTLGVDELEANDGIVTLYSTNYKTLIIRNNVKDATVNSVTLFSLSGQKIAYWDVKGREQSSIQIPIKNLPAEIYIVKIKTTQGDFSKKIIIK